MLHYTQYGKNRGLSNVDEKLKKIEKRQKHHEDEDDEKFKKVKKKKKSNPKQDNLIQRV